MAIHESGVGYIFNGMRNDYDDLRDLWYSWLFSRLHYFIAEDISSLWVNNDQDVLDIGCGTGFQSFLYSKIGARVTGVDIAADLVLVAQEKADLFDPLALDLFEPHHDYVSRYNSKIRSILETKFGKPVVNRPVFKTGNATNLEFEDGIFSHINCCGSVLSFVDDYKKAVAEIERVLRPGGTFIIEVEAKYSLDTIWTVVDSLTGGFIGYECSVREALAPFFPPFTENIKVEYPFGDIADPVYMPIRLFTRSRITESLISVGLEPIRTRTIHSITNLIPSTLLDSQSPSGRTTKLFKRLSKLEEVIPVWLPGCSLVITGRKPNSPESLLATLT